VPIYLSAAYMALNLTKKQVSEYFARIIRDCSISRIKTPLDANNFP